jgi:hypothetical protein
MSPLGRTRKRVTSALCGRYRRALDSGSPAAHAELPWASRMPGRRPGDQVLVDLPDGQVAMPTDDDAEALKQLLDQGGTGNVKELSRERGRYRAVRYTGDAYASRRDGTVVANAQAQPVARGWTGLTLTTIATNAVQ